MSELAKATGGERALIEECGGLLSKTHEYQVWFQTSFVSTKFLLEKHTRVFIWIAHIFLSGGRV